MDTAKDVARLVRYIYYLDEDDYFYMSCALTRSFDWMIPAVVGPWMLKRLYLIERPATTKRTRLGLSFLPLISPFLSWLTMYSIYYRNDTHLQELLKKYPRDMNMRQRPKLNPFKIGKNK
jgi:hypothetical protein